MTPKEMLLMRLDGATLEQIADASGITKQYVSKAIKNYMEKIEKGKRGRAFSCENIIYVGVYEHFIKNEHETLSSFTESTIGENGRRTNVMRNFLTGKTDSRFSIPQIMAICRICGKPFDEVFKVRDISGQEEN